MPMMALQVLKSLNLFRSKHLPTPADKDLLGGGGINIVLPQGEILSWLLFTIVLMAICCTCVTSVLSVKMMVLH